MTEAWAAIEIDPQRALVFSPRFGRLYLLPAHELRDAGFRRVAGLGEAARTNAIVDPVRRVVRDRACVDDVAAPAVPLGLKGAYLAMRASRSVLPLRACARLVRRAAVTLGGRWVDPGASSAEIGRTVRAIEDRSGAGDCYARALITAFLCLSARRACVLTIGVLAPTRKMHAWCCVEGDLPYEPSPEHYLYQPVWTLALAP